MATLIRVHITHWILDGKQVRKGTPGAVQRRTKSRKWYGIGIPGYPVRHRVPLCENKVAALQMLAQKCREGEMGLVGLSDKLRLAHAKELSKHLDDFRAHLSAGGNTAKHVRQQCNRLQAAFDGCSFKTLEHLSGSAFTNWLKRERDGTKDRKGISLRTMNGYIQIMSQFAEWLVHEKRISDNPFTRIPKGNVDTDRRLVRRAISPDEMQRLFDAARNSTEEIRGLSGADRYMLYRLAYVTGFRASALASLIPSAFDLERNPPTVVLAVTNNKSRKRKVNAIPDDFAAELRAYFVGRDPAAILWNKHAMRNAARMLRVDLDAAGIPAVIDGPDGPERIDFHAIRHTTATDLTFGDMRTAQEVMGHSTPTLTARYAKRNIDDQAKAVNEHLKG